MVNLTKRQKEILDFVESFINKNGYSPSVREIGDYFNLSSPATVHAHLSNLKTKGLLKSFENTSRSIEVVQESFARAMELALVGTITAGEPIEAIEERDKISVPEDFVRNPAETYVLKVKGESMIDDGILDGDFVIVEQKKNPQNGETVVALIDNTYATLKKFYREKGRIRLQPANKTMKPIYVKNVLVQGVVRGVMRKFA